MSKVPESVARFLSGRRFVVAGVSRSAQQPANAVLRKLRACGFEAIPVNPNAQELEGEACYPDVASVPGTIDGVIIATHPEVAAEVVRQAHARGVNQVWFHRSFGAGSVSEEAVRESRERGVDAIVGGCPLMYCQPVDLGHRCMRWWLGRHGRVPV